MATMEPTPEQFAEWLRSAVSDAEAIPASSHVSFERRLNAACLKIALLAYAAGADAGLDASCEWLKGNAMGKSWLTVAELADHLRAARRPKPPSLKQQALKALERASMDERGNYRCLDREPEKLIRKALETLPDD